MSDTTTPAKEPKKKSVQELINSPLDDLTNEEIERRVAYIRALAEEAKLEDTKNNLDDRKNKIAMKVEKLKSNGRELAKTARDQEMVQRNCSHRKGGRTDVPGGLLQGDSSKHSLIKHTLPTNELWIRCTRCCKTWKPVFRQDYEKGPKGDAMFAEAKEAYKWAVTANTDNSPSSSITFKWSSEDGNKSAEEFVHDTMKNVNLQ